MEGKLCRIAGETYYILPGFEKIAEEYLHANNDVGEALAITKGTFEIPSSAIKVADGLWKQEA